MTLPADTFACPNCGQQFPWQASMSGRKLMCSCGKVIDLPKSPAPQVESYDLAGDQGSPDAPLAESDIPEAKPQRVIPYARPRPRNDSELREAIKSDFRDKWLPLGLLAVCFMIQFILVMLLVRSGWTAPRIVGTLMLRMGWDVGITFIAGVIVARLLDVSFGAVDVATLKLATVAIARFTCWAVFGFSIPNIPGDIVGFLVSLPVLFGLLGYLFELDFRETFIAGGFITFVRLISYFGLWRLL